MEYLFFEVLVVGSGAAGLRAAISAKQKGLDVCVISKQARIFYRGLIQSPLGVGQYVSNIRITPEYRYLYFNIQSQFSRE